MNLYGIIYCAINTINNKRYIGQTIRGLNKRKREHINQAKLGSKYAFHLAINKYGEGVFDWAIIDVADSKEQLDKKETYWVNFYDTYKHGYNMTVNGQGYDKDDKPSIIKSIGNRTKNRLKNLKQKQDNHPFYIFDRYGKFIGESDNRLLFCAENNIPTNDCSKVLRNKNPSTGDFVLIHKEDYSEENLKQRLKRIRYNRDFVVFDKDYKYIGSWSNQLRCERDLGLKRGCINKVLTGVVKTINNYYFYYLDECPEDLKALIC